jgi:MarR family transcriptional regulator, lower aerobic nicotinate degradation pathway regulator
LWRAMLRPTISATRLSALIAFDRSTLGSASPAAYPNRCSEHGATNGIKALKLTAAGLGLLKRAEACVRRAQERILEPLPPDDRGKLMELLGRLVDLNNEASRVPLRLVG